MDDDTEAELADVFSGIERSKGETNGSAIVPKDRPRGILSQADREYLCGQKEYAHAQSEANRRQDIRERVINGLQDFFLLFLFLEPADRQQLAEEMGKKELDQSLEAMMAFAYLTVDQNLPRLERLIEHGVLLGANSESSDDSTGEATDVDADIDVNYNPDVDALYEKVTKGNTNQLTPAEIGVLVRAGKLESEDLDELADTEPSFPAVYAGGPRSDDNSESDA